MNSPVRYAIAAAAVLVLALVGYQLLPGTTPPQSGQPTASPPAMPTAAVTPDVRPDVPPSGAMDPAVRQFARIEGVGFTFEVPDGWVSNGAFGIDREVGIGPEGAGFIFWTENADAVFEDSCAKVLAPPVGPLAIDLAREIAGMPQLELVSGPTAVTVGGNPAQLVVVQIPDEIACDPESFYLWGDATNDEQARYATRAGSTIRVWLIDVGGARVQIDGETYAGAGQEPVDELESIVDSIEFE